MTFQAARQLGQFLAIICIRVFHPELCQPTLAKRRRQGGHTVFGGKIAQVFRQDEPLTGKDKTIEGLTGEKVPHRGLVRDVELEPPGALGCLDVAGNAVFGGTRNDLGGGIVLEAGATVKNEGVHGSLDWDAGPVWRSVGLVGPRLYPKMKRAG